MGLLAGWCVRATESRDGGRGDAPLGLPWQRLGPCGRDSNLTGKSFQGSLLRFPELLAAAGGCPFPSLPCRRRLSFRSPGGSVPCSSSVPPPCHPPPGPVGTCSASKSCPPTRSP